MSQPARQIEEDRHHHRLTSIDSRRRERDRSRLSMVEPFQLNPTARPLPRWARITLAVTNILGLSAAAAILYWVVVRGAAFYLFGVRL